MPKIIDHQERRSQILENSFQLFATIGYAGLSMRKIAKNMDMTTGMLYHYFSSKEQIFTDLLIAKQTKQIETFYQQVHTANNKEQALHQFLQTEEQDLRQLLSIAIEFHRHHPEQDLLKIADLYKQAFQEYLGISDKESHHLLITILGQLTFGLLGKTDCFA